MKHPILFVMVLLTCWCLYPGPGIADVDGPEAYGLLSRALPLQGKVVVTPLGNSFVEGAKVSFFDGKGSLICGGTVFSSYPDMAYVSVGKRDMEKLEQGFIVSHKGRDEFLINVSNYSMSIAMVLDHSVRDGQRVPPNEIELDYILGNGVKVPFHHYAHRYSCNRCHHDHHNAIDTGCRDCHNSETARYLQVKSENKFTGRVKEKCNECHLGERTVHAGLQIY